MTGDIGVVITSFVGVVMILRGLGSIISSESFLQKSDGFNALRVCGLVSAERCMHSTCTTAASDASWRPLRLVRQHWEHARRSYLMGIDGSLAFRPAASRVCSGAHDTSPMPIPRR